MKCCLLSLIYSVAYTLGYDTNSMFIEPYIEFLFDNSPNHTLSLPLANSKQVSTKAADRMDCVFLCTGSRPWCGSVNFNEKPEKDGLHICELLSMDMFSKPRYLNLTQGFTHLSIRNKCMDPSLCQNNGSCIPDYDNDDYHCVCNGTKGRNCEIFYRDCSELRAAAFTSDGVYKIDPDGQGSFSVFCDMTTAGGGWTVFQRKRIDTLVSFSQGWQAYKTGFGNLKNEFWLGLDKIHRMTKRQVTKLRVDLEDLYGTTRYAVYSSFTIADESDLYRLSVSGYSGTAGDPIATASNTAWINNNRRFSTPDSDNDVRPDGNCASNSGWWFGWCTNSNLNGNMEWWTFSKTLKNTQMKLM